ncbi:RagB/SusD family nutrient uptake outer membrane protein [Sinomicrobium weinanense]|uniref:RagB/SusD family nutrient uptake outer membrane protein n=1 Tax=Sinomicrobium weinanense TaxID=2842200 RepID=A0A926JV86_9FLAO|nr:RagB/SusD family nutrient uptake outer membrane protein [Sinomicrobium weinanense]MBC9797989.1 RagB/SusD family nutrient uptake outer membrane protein [Sinomicrobium weinanense]MBU3125580.1 RagB/SusD family nutrient uptake outer membrane protein [Sinomicrobium weinanense]
MKRSIKNIIVVTLLAVTTACSDFLEIDNPSAVTDDLYNTKDGQEKLLADIYAKYRNVFNTGELQYYGTDLYLAITESPDERMFNGYDASFNSTAGVVGPYWRNLYKIVQETNILLTRTTPETEGMTEETFNSITGQGRFLRALAYYYLVETFGPVPLYTEEQSEIITTTNRALESDIYTFLIAELEATVQLLTWDVSQPGIAQKGAALQLLGKVYLTRAYKPYAQPGDFSMAAATLDKIIDGADSPYALLDNYADVYDENNQNNSEVIWAIQYGLDRNFSGSGNPQQAQFGFNIVALEPDLFDKVQKDYSAMSRFYWVNPKVHELFDNPLADIRYDATFQREFYVNHPDSDHLGELGIYFPRWNDSSGNDMGALQYYPFEEEDEYVWYPQSTALPVLNTGSDRMPIIKKFKDTRIEWGGPGSREDVIFRLSGTYLLSAEAYLGAGNTATAIERINTLRKRAASTPSFIDQMEVSSIDLDFILDERARELLGEHDRWFHLKRTGKLIERARSYNIFVQKYDNISHMHLVRPIPQDEINKVNGLTQNEGY